MQQSTNKARAGWTLAGITMAALLLALLISSVFSHMTSSRAMATTKRVNQASSTTHKSLGQNSALQFHFTQFGNGTFVVGKDILPGTYRTRAASPGCTFARLGGWSGSADDVIANNTTNDPAVITIAPGD